MRTRTMPLLAALLLAASACSGSVAGSPSAASPAAPGSTGPSSTPPPTAAPTPVISSAKLAFDSVERAYRVAAPANRGRTPIPLLLVLHGYTQTPWQAASITGLDRLAADPGALVVYPAGYEKSWNAGACCGLAVDDAIDDVGFFAALIDQLEADYPVDPERIYVLGGSNGGEMAYRLGCELADRIAAVGVVVGALLGDCTPSRPISVIDIHGTADTAIPYLGGQGCQDVLCPSVPDTMERWRQIDGCTGDPNVVEDGVTVETTYSSCDAGTEVTFIKAIGKGHAWYASGPDDGAVTWEFFMRHPMSG
jgi:polyhydroxybutyrate depolymerase